MNIRVKALRSVIVFLLLCGLLLPAALPAAADEVPEPLFSALPEGKTYGGGQGPDVTPGFAVNVGGSFSLSAVVRVDDPAGVQVLFAKGDKVAGHYELWLNNGELAFFAPEMNGGGAVYTGILLTDKKEHHISFTCEGGAWAAYLDGSRYSAGQTAGRVSDAVMPFAVGGLTDGGYAYRGYIRSIRIDGCALTAAQISQITEGHTMEQETGEPIAFPYFADNQVKNRTAGTPVELQPLFTGCLGDDFTVSATVMTAYRGGLQVLFAKGPKISGHFELWINGEGQLEFYAPDLNGNCSVNSGVFVADGYKHHVGFSFREGAYTFWLDGRSAAMGLVDGRIADSTATLSLGGLVDSSFPFIGTLEDIRFDDHALTASEMDAIATVHGEGGEGYTPTVRESTYTPEKYTPTVPLRGVDRLAEPAALPLIDAHGTTGYSGSIDKQGGNADWDWGIYRDDKGEWVLFEAFGPGCIYNFTQHRYPTSEEPVFRFYLDDSDTPAFEIRQSEFGKKAPFLSPLSDIYQGPEDGGRGPIWVIRSFVPMTFTKYAKVTSSVKLEGNDKARGEGGWGHVTYVLYDTADGTPAFSPDLSADVLTAKAKNTAFDPKYSAENEIRTAADVTVAPDAPVTVLDETGAGSVASVKLVIRGADADPAVLSDLRVRMYWDGQETPAVDAPIGTLFGCEYGWTPCDNTQYMLGLEIMPGQYLAGYNYFPMPFWERARMELYTVNGRTVTVETAEVQITPASVVSYDKAVTGYFVSSAYYEKAPNTAGKNSPIARLDGTGHMVYGVLSGYGIGSGCEGDVRVFFDGRQSPEMESDGSESWASYGWGFVTPPQCNPFSGYNGQYNSNSNWSEVRLTLGDSCFFTESLVFELEHGCANEGMGSHSGQIFAYMIPAAARDTDRIDFADEGSRASHGFTGAALTGRTVSSAYANGVNTQNAFRGRTMTADGAVSFTLTVDPGNRGVILIRTSSQKDGRQAAQVAVDGVTVTERRWYHADFNPYYEWLDDSFLIPAAYTEGKTQITVTITPEDAGGGLTWNMSSLRAVSVLFGAPGSGGETDTEAETDPPAEPVTDPAPTDTETGPAAPATDTGADGTDPAPANGCHSSLVSLGVLASLSLTACLLWAKTRRRRRAAK